jgi:hypothetical protein
MVRGPIEQINFSVSAGWTIDFARIPGVGVCSGGGQALTCAVVRQPRTYPITVQVSGRGTGGTLHVVSIGLNGQTSDYPF